MMISAVFRKTSGLLKQESERLSVSFMGEPDLVTKEYNELKKKYLKLGYEVE